MTCHQASRGKRCGFTLVELLVVIAIIVVLIAILVPSLGRARDHSRLVLCQTHIRGWVLGFHEYAQNFNDALPLDGGDGTKTVPIGKWDDSFLWFNGVVAMSNAAGQTYNDLQTAAEAGQGTLPNLHTNSLFICPSALDPLPGGTGPTQDVVSNDYFQTYGWWAVTLAGKVTPPRNMLLCYGMNSQIRNWSWPAIVSAYPGSPSAGDISRLNQLDALATTVLMAEKRIRPDELPKTDANYSKNLAQNKVAPTRFAARHQNGGNIAFADAHVEWFSNAAVNAADSATPQYNQPGIMIWNPQP